MILIFEQLESHQDTLNFLLVSRRFYGPCLPILYRDVSIDCGHTEEMYYEALAECEVPRNAFHPLNHAMPLKQRCAWIIGEHVWLNIHDLRIHCLLMWTPSQRRAATQPRAVHGKNAESLCQVRCPMLASATYADMASRSDTGTPSLSSEELRLRHRPLFFLSVVKMSSAYVAFSHEAARTPMHLIALSRPVAPVRGL